MCFIHCVNTPSRVKYFVVFLILIVDASKLIFLLNPKIFEILNHLPLDLNGLV